MNRNPSRKDWFFPIHEAPVLATVTHNGVVRNVPVPHKKALVAADTGHIVGIVGAGYKLFTNQEAVNLYQKFCLEAFPPPWTKHLWLDPKEGCVKFLRKLEIRDSSSETRDPSRYLKALRDQSLPQFTPFLSPTRNTMSELQDRCAELQQTMLEVLTELFEHPPFPEVAPDSDEGEPSHYRFSCGRRSSCRVWVSPFSDRSATLNVHAALGRCYTGYSQALRWLANNRAHNTVAMAVDEGIWCSNELSVSCTRITYPTDAEGIREVMFDFDQELSQVELGLNFWFPQMLAGADIARVHDKAEDDEGRELEENIISDPRAYITWLEINQEDALTAHADLPAIVYSWLGDWEQCLEWSERCWTARPASLKTPEARISYLHMKCIALQKTQNYEELMRVSSEMAEVLSEPDAVSVAMMRCAALAGLGRYAELLRLVHSSHFDDDPPIWFWRSLAHLNLGNEAKSMESLSRYEKFIGPDLCARNQIRILAQKLGLGRKYD